MATEFCYCFLMSRPPAARPSPGRRLHLVELTPAGDALFLRLRDAATAFDRQLRAGLSDSEIGQLETLLTRLRDNVAGPAAQESGG